MRFNEIDGIRGWAAFIVLIFHTFGEMLKYVSPVVQSPWLSPFFAGGVAVAVFFVLSGDALSSSFFAGGEPNAIDRLVVRRYFRLTIPVFLSCLITYLIMTTGLDYHKEAAVILKRPDWLGIFLNFNESLLGFIRYSLIGVYTSHTKELSYNPVLWTMSIEMAGSMIVFILCYVWKRLNDPEWVCAGLAVILTLIGSSFGLFFAGMLFGAYRRKGLFENLLTQRNHQFLAFAIVFSIIFISIFTSGMLESSVLRLVTPLIAVLLVFCFYSQKHFKSFFCNKLSRFLGEISFPLYLVHFQVLISLMSWLVIQDFTTRGVIDQNTMLVFGGISAFVSLLLAWGFRFIERFILKRIDPLVLKVLI